MIVGSELRIMARIAWRIEGPSPIHSPNQIWWKVPILCRGFLTNLESRCKIKAPARTVCPKRRRNCFYIVIANIKWEMVLIWGLSEKRKSSRKTSYSFKKWRRPPQERRRPPQERKRPLQDWEAVIKHTTLFWTFRPKSCKILVWALFCHGNAKITIWSSTICCYS